MYLVLDQDFAFLGKSELLKWPVINLFFKRGVDIPVYRNSKTKASECLIIAEKEIKKGRSVVIFPEGGWDNAEKGMRKFKNGAENGKITEIGSVDYAYRIGLFKSEYKTIVTGR